MGLGKTYSTQYLLDSNNNSGVAGQVLSTTSTGIDWVDANTVPGAGLWLENSNDIYNSNSGNVGIGVTSPSTKLEVLASQSNSSIRAGGLEMQSYAVNNSWYAENLYYNAGWKLRSNGYATQMYMQGGKITFNRFVSGNAGDFVTPYPTMILDSNGNVGIGTTSPTGKFNSYISATRQLTHNGNGGDLSIISDNNSSPVMFIKGTGSADLLNVFDNTTEVFTILDGGNVGIGTATPGTFLQLGSYPVSGTYVNNATYPDVPSEHMIHLTAPSTTGYFGGGISFGENAFTAANITAVDAGGGGALHLAFGTGNSSGMTERVRIANNGNVGIGQTGPGQKLVIGNYGSAADGTMRLTALGGQPTAGTIRNSLEFSLSSEFSVNSGDAYKFSIGLNSAVGNQGSYNSDFVIRRTTRLGITDNVDFMIDGTSGNVGIGTTSPATKLNVANAGEVIVRSSMTAADGFRGGFEADNQHTGGTIWSMFSTNNSDGYFGGGKYVIANESMGGVDANTTAKFVIDGSGNVGIGTTSPGAKLVLATTAGASTQLRLQRSDGAETGMIYMDTNDDLNIRNTGGSGDIILYPHPTSGKTIVNYGNVGIGTTSPLSKLTIDAPVGNFANGTNAISLNYDGGSSPGDVGGGIVFSQKWWSASAGQQVTGGIFGIKHAGNGSYGGGLGFYTQPNGASNMAQHMVIRSTGEVGIGTTDPGQKLSIFAGTNESVYDVLGVYNSVTGTTAQNKGAAIRIGKDIDGNYSTKIATIYEGNNPSFLQPALAFYTMHNTYLKDSETEKMRISSNGNVGIGFTSPGSTPLSSMKLSVNGNGYFAGNVGIGTTEPEDKLEVSGGALKIKANASATLSPSIKLGRSDQANGNYENHISSQTGSGASQCKIEFKVCNTTATGRTTLLSLDGGNNRSIFQGNVGIGYTSPGSQLSIYKTAFGGDTAGSGGTLDFGVGSTKYWQFRLDSSSSGDLAIDKTYASVWTTPVTIQRSSGNVGIGTDSPECKLHVVSTTTDNTKTVLIQNSSTGDASIMFNISGDTYSLGIDNSDGDKFKLSYGALGTNDMLVIDSSGNATFAGDVVAFSDIKLKENIKTLDGSKVYNMRGVSFTRKDNGNESSGVIAQEIQKIAPELVNETDGTLGVAYGNLTGYLIEAIKELKAEIEELKKHSCDCKK